MSSVSRVALALFFIVAGTAHFISPAPYLAIVPTYLPRPAAIVVVSGVAEILGGIGVCFRATRRAAGCVARREVRDFSAKIRVLS